MPNAEYGLRFPDGTEIWPHEPFLFHDYQTFEGRQKIVETIGQTCRTMRLPVIETFDRYRWLVREKKGQRFARGVYDIDDPRLLDPDLEASPSIVGTQYP